MVDDFIFMEMKSKDISFKTAQVTISLFTLYMVAVTKK